MADDLASRVSKEIDAAFNEAFVNSAISRETALWNMVQDFKGKLKARITPLLGSGGEKS